MAFNKVDVQNLLVKCHRRCCICHRFCGIKIETDHIVPQGERGDDTIENAIPVCFEYHAEIHSYNDKHPRGRKFQPEELRGHREQWLKICTERPEVLINAATNGDVGPLQSLIDELDFNATVAHYKTPDIHGCLFYSDQFKRAISEGAVALLNEDLRKAILEAYVAIGRANEHIAAAASQNPSQQTLYQKAAEKAQDSITKAEPKIEAAKIALLKLLGNEPKELTESHLKTS